MKNLLLTLTMLLPALGFAFATESSTDSVWQHHIEAWESRDLDAIVDDYDVDSYMIINNQVFLGKVQIREVFRQLFEIFDHGQNRIDKPIVRDRIVYITWNFTPASNQSIKQILNQTGNQSENQEYYGTDTFLIENGKIKVQTIASPLYELFPIKAGRE